MKKLWNKLKPLILGWTIKGMVAILEQRGYVIYEPIIKKDTTSGKVIKLEKDEV